MCHVAVQVVLCSVLPFSIDGNYENNFLVNTVNIATQPVRSVSGSRRLECSTCKQQVNTLKSWSNSAPHLGGKIFVPTTANKQP